MKQMILEIDAAADFSAMPQPLQNAIKRAKIQWPQAKMIGTKEVDGKKLILILCDIEADQLDEWMNGVYIDSDETEYQFNLGWEILAVEGVKIKQGPILKYMPPVNLYDDDFEVIDTKIVTSLRGILQTWAGHKWQF
jgi:hypothetical protein